MLGRKVSAKWPDTQEEQESLHSTPPRGLSTMCGLVLNISGVEPRHKGYGQIMAILATLAWIAEVNPED
jgi:hypothetical protein